MSRVLHSAVSDFAIRRSRKILCIAGLLACVLTGAGEALGAGALTRAGDSGGSVAAERGDLQRASLSQAGRELILTVRTAAPVSLTRLDRFPDTRSEDRYLCLELRRAGRQGLRRLCLGGAKARRRIGLELVNAAGKATEKRTLATHVKRPRAGKLAVALEPADAGLAPHRYRWRVVEGWRGCRRLADCREALPTDADRVFRLRPVREVGCTGGGAGLVTNGSRGSKVVALTFDDGPSDYTPEFLKVLRDKHARGTFFEIGQEVAGHEATMRQILAEGSEIGNHTMHHGSLPSYDDLAATSARIEAATHFRPCLFRPPGGGVDAAVIAAAGEAGMRTVTWDVDPSDWTNPGSGAVYGRVVDAARPGSIILMHDGGGDRGGTLAALPRIIDALRARGYRFATVTELLGYRGIYKPYG
ncbi:MAG TPA: polysaccharide deacetylase family protein [Solirubrobacterales bacterium]